MAARVSGKAHPREGGATRKGGMEFIEAESTQYTNGRPCAQCISGMTNLHAHSEMRSLCLAPAPPKPGPKAVEPQRALLAPQACVVRALGRAIDRRRCPTARSIDRRVICAHHRPLCSAFNVW